MNKRLVYSIGNETSIIFSKKIPCNLQFEKLQGTTLLFVGAIYIIWFGLIRLEYRSADLHLH